MRNLHASLNRVMRNLVPDIMPVQKYDIRKPESEGGGFEERYWNPVNSPILNDGKQLLYIVHRAEDVTEFVRLRQLGTEQHKITEELQTRKLLLIRNLIAHRSGIVDAKFKTESNCNEQVGEELALSD